jgi:hypothetical protein
MLDSTKNRFASENPKESTNEKEYQCIKLCSIHVSYVLETDFISIIVEVKF